MTGTLLGNLYLFTKENISHKCKIKEKYDTGIYTVYGSLLEKMHFILHVNKICYDNKSLKVEYSTINSRIKILPFPTIYIIEL